ncbi:MAG: hypothetical protein KKB20_19985 [Proteobacteria bacterium]|nr:hypothetical protein [Pseudomonadota bacterium]
MKFRGRPEPQVTAERLAEAARPFVEPVRSSLVRFLGRVFDSDPRAALRCADNAAGVLGGLSLAQRRLFLSRAEAMAERTVIATEFFCRGSEPLCFLNESEYQAWIDEGLALGADNPGAAAAFFRQESQAGMAALSRRRQSVHLGDVSRILQLYCTAISGKKVGVKSVGEAPDELIRDRRPFPLTDGKTVFLPETVKRYAAWEDNFESYKVLAAHQAGYLEFGTFDLDLDRLRERPEAEGLAWDRAERYALASHYELFFQLFDDPVLARDVFFAVEDGRIDFLLRRKYRGLVRALDRAEREALADRPDLEGLPFREALVEILIRFSLGGPPDEAVAGEARGLAAETTGIMSGVFRPDADVIDSAAAAVRICLLLGPARNLARVSSPGAAARAAEQAAGLASPGSDLPGEEDLPYLPAQPVDFRGQTSPDLVQFELAVEMLQDSAPPGDGEGVPLSKELLEELMKRGAKIKISQMTAKELADAQGLFVTDLQGLMQEKIKSLSPEDKKRLARLLQKAQPLKSDPADGPRVFYYDEWDYLIGDYRPHWCKLREITVEGESSEIVNRIQKERAALIHQVRRHFQRIRPEMLHRVNRLPSGEDVELNAAIEAVIDRRAGLTPSERIYQQRDRRRRDVATAFLLDLSASTNEFIEDEPGALGKAREAMLDNRLDEYMGRASVGPVEPLSEPRPSQRVIDVEREALVIMAEALESLGDEYAIYGFSGYGRDNVEFVTVKDFSERYSERARCRIGALKSRTSTRMGPAIRHTLDKLDGTGCRLKVMILLSDGYPQDYDYGPDRMSRDYGLHDTMVALREARRRNIHTFLVTVDQAGNDYLQEMCAGENYLVVKRPSALPRILPQVYRGLTA